ncbi:MAG: geranylgeranyl reductase family protein [Cyclobacteriaceae bacterium]|nr:MAG: geranylgeranyl reductase family protein [Cyclobacteriaceae bacterium]
MTAPDFDVAVIGAGPAGSTAALAMLNSGLRVALIDMATFPRDKTCGDAVAAYVPKVLATISDEFRAEFEAFSKRQVVHICRVFAPNGQPLDFKFSESGNIIKRTELDNFLCGLAQRQKHVTPFFDCRVNSIAFKPNQKIWELQTASGVLHAKLIIGCDGANSVVTRQLSDGRLLQEHHSAAVRAYFTDVEGVNPESFELHFINELPLGYFWIFPESDGSFNVGLGALSKFISDKQLNLRELLQHVVTKHDSISKRFTKANRISDVKGFGLPLGSRKIPISGNAWMLCGDAAHLIDPLTGEGIGQAMASGRFAGWMAVDCFKKNNFSAEFMKSYDRQVYKKFWAPHRKSYLMQRYLVPRFTLFNKVFELAHRSPVFRRWLQRAVL